MTTPTFTISAMAYDYSDDTLEVSVDSQHYRRGYTCTWHPHCGLIVREHWSDDCRPTFAPLPRDERRDLERFLDANDDVAEAYARLSSEPAPVHGSRRSA